MSKNKNRRKEANGDLEASEAEESYLFVADHQNAANKVEMAADEEDNINSHTNNTNSGKARRKRDGGTPQAKQKHNLGKWSDAVSDSFQKIEAAQKALQAMGKEFAVHKEEIESIDATTGRIIQLQIECKDNQDEIQRQANTITTLSKMSRQKEEEVAQQRADNEREKKDLEIQRAKLEKRSAVILAEKEKKMMAEYEELVQNLDRSHNERKKELDDKNRVQENEHQRIVSTLQSENSRLSAVVDEQNRMVSTQTERLTKSDEHRDLLERAMDSHKKEKEARERELDKMKMEFALSSISKDEFKQRFANVHEIIENISFNYFHGIDGKSSKALEKVSKDLIAADPCFQAVPVDESEDSSDLQSAHAQRILSEAIYEHIWKPFRSDFTFSHPEFDSILNKVSYELERGSRGGRASSVWAALTMRALQDLPAESDVPDSSALRNGQLHLSSSGRVDFVISRILGVLSPLVNTSQSEKLRTDLVELIETAINVWNEAQKGELRILVISSLDRTNREEWRSQTFDPLLESHGNRTDINSQTHPRILTLFPRIIAREVVDPIQSNAALPGSWPIEAAQGPQMVETCIHPGIGLPEWSPLVLRGIAAQEEKEEAISRAIENATVEVLNNRRITGQGRRESMGNVTSAPSSPIQQWKSGGTMKYT